MLYHTIHKTRERYQLTVMWVLIVAFFIALPFMFIHPTVVIALFWIGLMILGLSVPGYALIMGAERAAARRALARHRCPECGADLEPGAEGSWSCERCGSASERT